MVSESVPSETEQALKRKQILRCSNITSATGQSTWIMSVISNVVFTYCSHGISIWAYLKFYSWAVTVWVKLLMFQRYILTKASGLMCAGWLFCLCVCVCVCVCACLHVWTYHSIFKMNGWRWRSVWHGLVRAPEIFEEGRFKDPEVHQTSHW
jgi:hypothetical protein